MARVNDSFLTEEMLSELTDTSITNQVQIKQIINNWVHSELLYQHAEKNGIFSDREYKRIINNSKRQLAGALLLKKITSESEVNVLPKELEKYYLKNKNSFILSSNYFLLNRIKFNDYIKAVQFRSEMISGGWENVLSKFENDTSVTKYWNKTLISEFEIYPKQILRVLEGLYPLEISIVISDEPGYYAVVEVLNRFNKGSVPPFEVMKPLVEKRYTAELEKLAIEKYIEGLYTKSKIEINH
ncbi:MAG: peptidyl-prolyl cis-trans isomerase [Ignavibacteria bacterium]|nr:peptidyl-prolyl cis-trans isomerase [Ignavibacteria bacterium]MBT8381951.1 peptidyl-prolyl cis-trans isomerase [Ignavibacteria bacterium]MBT8392788.1 peptidyl-prolyl cis-trans isomerase [Ignavibacteria bacterium]NNJ54349.1 peptidyl-prolyl cis-trans isomerase [Ignavibacteriaceae bacterium]NNL20534.1 peptidyl-prolyl cis-trans isomerase [Ignavibacteriaceae bacterium]